MQCEQIRDLLEAYALGALDEDQRAAVEAHLADCVACQRMADELLATASQLPLALAAVSPLRLPASAKDRLLQALGDASVAATQDADGEPVAPDGAAPQPPVPVPPERGEPSPSLRIPPGRRWPVWRRLRIAGALAAVLLVLLSLSWSVQLSAALARERALRAEYAQLVSEQQELVIDILDSPKTTKAVLRPTQPGSKAYGKLFTRPDLPHVLVMAARLPAPPAGQTYYVWLTQAGQPQLVGELGLNQGFGALVFDADRTGPVYAAAQVTLQPKGSTSPGGTTVLEWQASP